MKWIAVAALCAVSYTAAAQPSPHFEADWTFRGSDLSEWHTIGSADWEATDGTITGEANGQGGWLVLDDSYQDAQLFTRFDCGGACDTGILFRLQEAGNGYEGLFVELADSLRLFSVSLNESGRITDRTPLNRAEAMIRISPDGSPVVPAPAVGIRESGWNEISITLNANILGPHLNGWGFSSGGVTGDTGSGYGPIALYVGNGSVDFEDVALKDENLRAVPAERTSNDFTMQRLDDFYYAWDAAVADINRDGVNDVVAGPYYFLGPDYTKRREIYLGIAYNPSTEYTDNMVTHAADFTGDGWPDVLATESRPMVLYVNPRGENRRWDRYPAIAGVVSEATVITDIDRDDQPDVVYAMAPGVLAWSEPDPANPTAPWTAHRVSESMDFGNVIHGIGAGDVNGDGRNDILNSTGWWEQPARLTPEGTWTRHEFPFGAADGLEGAGGGKMSVADLNGDGLNDVVTSLNAHGWGLAWFEQTRGGMGAISFTPHLVMGDYSSDNPGDVAVSELHSGVEVADMNGDGRPDLVTGKRYWAHRDSSTDPDPYGTADLYWFRNVPGGDGGATFRPNLIHNRSGVGSQFEVVDVNEDGAVDVVTSNDRGTFIFWGK